LAPTGAEFFEDSVPLAPTGPNAAPDAGFAFGLLQVGPQEVGSEGEIFRRVIAYSLILTSAVGVVAMIEAYAIPWIVPTP
jgi:hypothetical protein